ncbi:MAG: bifunctional [glutamine synthetase] adenylyltransferase/[glutamine synthetase]-adenylyl-L-tyrosine phosphorylase [Hyphomicrobiales bacterium]|nr:bifunctional [glutamine synthetase] adenylyltransferase/[glutamine synthetase]-adenylyl-L-tyrosine phosphorylase [Hyphomicrobiales bacterium]
MNWIPPNQLSCLDEQRAQLFFDDIVELWVQGEWAVALQVIETNECFRSFLRAVISFSPYLRDRLAFDPGMLDELLSSGFEQFCENILQETEILGKQCGDESSLMSSLRKMKSRIALATALADLGGWWNCEKVTATLSEFADAALITAIDFAFLSASKKQHFDLADPSSPSKNSGLIVLAMGKHGAHELNYSSDIDLILFYDERAASGVNNSDPATFFSRFAKVLVKLLQERTAEGYVFRVDLRLRPDPSSTPPIMPLKAGLIYYESYGQNWERAAMIKARPAAGDIEAGYRFLKELTPFIWRKYLDYAAIQDVHSIKRQIHAHKGHATIATRGHNIKLGRGGIREIEFFAQTQQLIAGGRMPQLRTIRTIETVETLHQFDWIDARVVDELTKAYWYLRNVEHRLQMVRDEQTHTLPLDDNEFLRISKMMGYDSSEAFTLELTAMLLLVETHYSSLFEMSPELSSTSGNLVFTGDDDDPHTMETLSSMGYHRPSDIMRTIKGWHFARYPALRTSQARELLTELTPMLLQEFAQTGRADETLIAMDRFISGLPAGIQLFALLKSNPPLLRLLTLLLSAAPRLSDIITRRPHVFDGLLDPAFNSALPQRSLLADRLKQFLAKGTDYELVLNRARIFAAEQKFLIGVRLINGTINATQAGRAFSDLAEVMVNAMLETVRSEFESKHGRVAGSAICVLAMGRLGSRELTAGSDLDLILLYKHDVDAEVSVGPKQLPVSLYYTRLIQRFIAAMGAPTAEGVIYELDFRLRPSGNAGPLATHLDAFVKYQCEQAWTWERQALTRARPVAGETELCAVVEAELAKLVIGTTARTDIKSDIAEMRYRIEKEKGSGNPWDTKNVAGGLIDLEFIAQWLVLQNKNLPQPSARNTMSVIQSERGNLINEEDCDLLLSAFELYNTILQLLRSCLDSELDPTKAPKGLLDILCQATGHPDIAALAEQLLSHQSQVRQIFIRLIG